MGSNQGQSWVNNQFSFIHASDLHIGSQQFTNLPLAQDYIRALSTLLNRALILKVNFVILGGDIFTSRDLLPTIFQSVITILLEFHQKSNNQVPIIAIEGNHDIRRYSHGQKLASRSSWLQVLHSLRLIVLLDIDEKHFEMEGFQDYDPATRSGSVYRMPNVAIFGSSYHRNDLNSFIAQSANLIPNIQNSGRFHIFLQHFGIAGQMKNVPGISLQHVRKLRQNVHYLALGHYHLGYQLDNWIFNPGCPEAVSPSETGFNRGIFYVKVSRNQGKYMKSVDRIHLVNRPYSWHSVQVPYGINSLESLAKFIVQKVINSPNYIKETEKSKFPRLFISLRGVKPRNFSNQIQKALKIYLSQQLSAIEVRLYTKFSQNGQNLDYFFPVRVSKLSRETA